MVPSYRLHQLAYHLGQLHRAMAIAGTAWLTVAAALAASSFPAATRSTGGRRPARSGSARTRSRWCTSGTPRCTSSTTKATRRSAFTKAELHAFFEHCDNEVARIRAFGRKGWLPAFRDATLFKTAYAYGLRRNETRMLDAADFGRNPHGRSSASSGRAGSGSARPGKGRRLRRHLDATVTAALASQEARQA